MISKNVPKQINLIVLLKYLTTSNFVTFGFYIKNVEGGEFLLYREGLPLPTYIFKEN